MRAPWSRDRGQVAFEYIGFVPIMLLVALAGIQLGAVAYAHEQAGTAARAAARTEARKGYGGDAAGHAAVSGGFTERLTLTSSVTEESVTFTATITIPSIFPGIELPAAVRRSKMPNDAPAVSGP